MGRNVTVKVTFCRHKSSPTFNEVPKHNQYKLVFYLSKYLSILLKHSIITVLYWYLYFNIYFCIWLCRTPACWSVEPPAS